MLKSLKRLKPCVIACVNAHWKAAFLWFIQEMQSVKTLFSRGGAMFQHINQGFIYQYLGVPLSRLHVVRNNWQDKDGTRLFTLEIIFAILDNWEVKAV